MHSLNLTKSNLTALMRQVPAELRTHLLAKTRSPVSSSHRSIVSDSARSKRQDNKSSPMTGKQMLHRTSARLANTSSGFYAPSTTIINSKRNDNQTSPNTGNLNVFEDSEHLPSLPVPDLQSTLEKLKESVSSVAMNSTEYVNTLKLIDKFGKTAGPKLNLLLNNKAKQTKNWMANDWWLQEAYLKSRRPLVINSNPSMIYPKLPFDVKNQHALVNVISQFISGIIDFKCALIHGYNPEATNVNDEYRLDPSLCYSQYKNIFGGTRLPAEGQDIIRALDSSTFKNDSLTIVVSFRGKFFEIELKNIDDEKGRIDILNDILEKIIKSVKSDNLESNQLDGAGVLTTARRDDWAKNFKLLDEESMVAIQNCQFVVNIDTVPTSPDDPLSTPSAVDNEKFLAALGRQILHGDSVNVGNRWFDKGLQLIVVSDENAENLLGAGVNYEHSFSEAAVVAKLIEYSHDKIIQNHRESSKANFFAKQQVAPHDSAVFRQLRMFDDSKLDEIAKQLKRAKQDYVSQVDQFELSYLNYKQYGSNSIKSWHFSPDSWFQVALLAAYHNVHKRLGTCYESASTRRFAYGRTETIRSLTKEVAQFCLEPRFDNMQSAIKSHKAYAISAGNGVAIDRVLLGYKKTFDELKTNKWSWGLPTINNDNDSISKLSNRQKTLDEETNRQIQNFNVEELFSENELNVISAFFNNELIKRSNKYALSTSQVSSIHPDIYMCYGPFLVDGYGCCYNITGQQIVAAISANSSNQSFSCEVAKLHEGIEQSLDTMRNIVEEEQARSKKQ